jgi:hypothetical protein
MRGDERDQRIEALGVEAVVGLVEDEQRWRTDEGGAQARAPALAERHLVERRRRDLVEAERVDERGVGWGRAARGGAQGPQLGAGEEARRVRSLGDVAERRARADAARVIAPGVRAGDEDAAVARLEDAGDGGEERGLAATVLADDADDLAAIGGEREVLEDRAAAAANRELLDGEDAQRGPACVMRALARLSSVNIAPEAGDGAPFSNQLPEKLPETPDFESTSLPFVNQLFSWKFASTPP